MTKVEVEIETFDEKLLSDLFEFKEGEWQPRLFKEGASAEYKGSEERLAVGLPSIEIIVLEIIKDLAIGVISAWLYEKIKGRAVTLRIEKTEIEIDKGEIERILLEKIEKKE